MELIEAIKLRHSVRSFTDKKIEGETEASLRKAIEECNKESDLNIQLCLNEPKAFDSIMSHYGKFKNCKNYIALVGKKGTDEKCGYYGEKLVLLAQQLGINTCWVAVSYNKSKAPCKLNKGEKIQLVIVLGYGTTVGVSHTSKDMNTLCKVDSAMPAWFKSGMEAALLAPTAINQQKFLLTLKGNTVTAKALTAFYSKLDLGIVKYHFEVGAGNTKFIWK